MTVFMILQVLSYRNQPSSTALVGRYAEDGGTLGRSPDNALVLEDPSKYISRVHARVSFREGGYFLEDLGSNPSIVNDRPLGKGREVRLEGGDQIVVGDYLLQVGLVTPPPAAMVAPAPLNNATLPLFEPPPLAPPAILPPLQPLSTSAPAPAVGARLPDSLASARILEGAAGQGMPLDDPLGLNLFGNAPASGFGVHDLNPPASFRGADSDHLSPELFAFTLPSAPAPAFVMPAAVVAATVSQPGAMGIPDDYDLMADFSPRTPLPTALAPNLEAMAESALVHVPPVLTAPQQPLGAVIHSAADGEVLQALLRGLGLPDLTFKGSATELAENVGAMLREATAGTMDVLMARALTKKESRVDMTMIAVRSNNPLKFFPNADSALTQLLTNAMAGYMPAVQAVGSAFDDIKAHELSVIAGMRAALMALLERFDPVQFEQRLAPATVMEKMAGGASRKAKMWDQMVEVHTQVAREVDGTQGLFGGTFSSAYQAQIDRLSRGDN